jgi:hypothetical protein
LRFFLFFFFFFFLATTSLRPSTPARTTLVNNRTAWRREGMPARVPSRASKRSASMIKIPSEPYDCSVVCVVSQRSRLTEVTAEHHFAALA